MYFRWAVDFKQLLYFTHVSIKVYWNIYDSRPIYLYKMCIDFISTCLFCLLCAYETHVTFKACIIKDKSSVREWCVLTNISNKTFLVHMYLIIKFNNGCLCQRWWWQNFKALCQTLPVLRKHNIRWLFLLKHLTSEGYFMSICSKNE